MSQASAPVQPDETLRKAIDETTQTLNADIIFYCGDIGSPACWILESLVKRLKQRRENVLLFLTTMGGSADEAFRLARSIQNYYPKGRFSILVATWCKSAGTLIAFGADEIIMTDRAELGPLDVQVTKKDELGERTSGLTPIQALATLQVQANESFLNQFMDVSARLGGLLSTRTSTQIAPRLTVGCFSGIYGNIDPMRLAEFQRAILIAKQYGMRLSDKRGNIKAETIDRLVNDYPSHEFVIDRREAETLFSKVRPPSESEEAIVNNLARRAMSVLTDERRTTPLIEMLSVDLGQQVTYKKGGAGHDRRSLRSGKTEPATKPNGKGTRAASNTQSTVGSSHEGENGSVSPSPRNSKMRRSVNGRK